jgi:hypothetical protein
MAAPIKNVPTVFCIFINIFFKMNIDHLQMAPMHTKFGIDRANGIT